MVTLVLFTKALSIGRYLVVSAIVFAVTAIAQAKAPILAS
jgi:hypothetical protein